MRPARLLLGLVGLTGVTLTTPDAVACGGTFCDTGPTAMPVDQSGENILFVLDGGYVEAHVQIQYQGAAERFAWVVPMPAIPEVKVGSELLFQSMLNSTVPSYGAQTQFDQCSSCDANGTGGTGGSSAGSGGGAGAGGGGGAGGGPSVVFQEAVGAFEVTVLQGGTAVEVNDWLVANGYQTSPRGPELLSSYVANGFVFVAIKLTADATATQIHPLVFRYPGSEPCVPIRLTAVAATQNMGIRAFFLGDDRVYPKNYKHVVLNDARFDWLNNVANYEQVVTRAVDSAVANGKAFVTEYAGTSQVVPTWSLYSTTWSGAPFATIDPVDVIDALEAQGLVYCQSWGCTFSHPLIRGILRRYLPVPATLTEEQFYDCLACNASLIDATAWDAAGLSTDITERIVEPGQRAVELLTLYPYLTRLYTTMSPAEMTLDPDFHARPDLTTPVDARSVFATRRFTCDSKQGVILPTGNQVGLDGTGLWPTFSSSMPWAARIEEVPATGAPIVLVDNTATIEAALVTHNTPLGWPAPPPVVDPSCSGGSGGTPGTGGAAGAGATGAGGAAGAGAVGAGGVAGAGGGGAVSGRGGGGGSVAVTPTSSGDPGGCAVGARRADALGWLAALLGGGLAARRRRGRGA